MKKPILICLTLLPFLALGQINSNNKISGEQNSPTVIGFEKHLISSISNAFEKNTETALINDTRYYLPTVKFNLSKSNDVSLTTKNDIVIKVIDEQKLNQMLLKVKPLIYNNSHFR